MTSTTMPDGSVMSYEYDAADRLTAIENGVGERIEYAYDGVRHALLRYCRPFETGSTIGF